jgi:putative transposase
VCPRSGVKAQGRVVKLPGLGPRPTVRARGHFPNEAAALKCIYMALMSLDPTGKGRKRWTMRWKAPLNAFQIAFEGRLSPSNN